MKYTHKAVYGDVWWLCGIHGHEFLCRNSFGDCGSFETGHLSVEEFYREADWYVVTKLKQFTGNT